MGKSNRVRTERASSVVTKATPKKTKKNSSKAYSIIIALVALFVLVTIVASIIASSGVLMRNAKAMSTENYTITGSMFNYMVMAGYDDFLSNYSSYLSYFSLDTKKSLASQTYGKGSETAFLGAFEGTWLDYFVSSAKEQANQILIYCEEAKTRGIVLDDSDKANIDAAIGHIESDAQKGGYSLDAYISLVYGKGTKVKDIRKTMELSTLAAKAAEVVDKEIVDGITEEEVKGKYEADVKKYDVVDYLSYTVSVSYKDVAMEVIEGYDGKAALTDAQKETVLAKYKEKIAEAKKKSEDFMNFGKPEDFLNAVLNDVAKQAFDNLYKSEALKAEDKLSEDNLKLLGEKMIAKVLDEISKDETHSDDTIDNNGTITAYEITLTANAAKAVDNIKTKLITSVETAKDTYGTQQQKYNEKDDFASWAFKDGRKANDMHTINSGDGAKDDNIKNESGYFTADIYFIEKPQYRDDTYSKNVAYMSFTTRDAAQKAIDAIKAGEKLELSRFEAIAKEKGATSNGLFENYLEGQLTYNGFEDWLYDEHTLVGSYTATPLANATKDASEYAVFFYVENGEKVWEIDVKNDIFADDYQAYYKTLTEKYPVTTNDKTIAKVDI